MPTSRELAPIIRKYARRRDIAVACAKSFLRILESEGTTIDPLKTIEYESAKAQLAALVGAVRTGVSE